MIKLTRISDGRTYWYDGDTCNDTRECSTCSDPVLKELVLLAEFLKDNNVVEKLDEILRRYS